MRVSNPAVGVEPHLTQDMPHPHRGAWSGLTAVPLPGWGTGTDWLARPCPSGPTYPLAPKPQPTAGSHATLSLISHLHLFSPYKNILHTPPPPPQKNIILKNQKAVATRIKSLVTRT